MRSNIALLTSFFTAAGSLGLLCGALLAIHRQPAPPVMAAAADPGVLPSPADPDLVYTLPPGELVPHQMYAASAEAGDVADWGHAAIGVPDAWAKSRGKGAVVAVLDTGADPNHRDLKGQVKAFKDFSGSRSGYSDVNGHGTHTATTVGAAKNDAGMVGVAPECQLLIGKVLGDSGSGLSTWIAAGIDWAVANGAHVVTMRLLSSSADPVIQNSVRKAVAAGVIVIAAAGNEGPREGTVGYPGGFPESICVAAVDSNQKVANFSSRGPRVDVAAPGVNVRAGYPGDRFATMSGTSMATPYVAGCAALYVSDCLSRGAKPGPAEFRKLVTDSSKDLPPAGKDTGSGYGLIQPARLVQGPPAVVPVPVPGTDRWEVAIPPEWAGRKPSKLIVEFEPPKP